MSYNLLKEKHCADCADCAMFAPRVPETRARGHIGARTSYISSRARILDFARFTETRANMKRARTRLIHGGTMEQSQGSLFDPPTRKEACVLCAIALPPQAPAHVRACLLYLGLSECERAFRESLTALLNDLSVDLPWQLAEALVEHLYRVDGDGRSLCFANPERERLLAELTPVLLAHLETR
jgi:hypothetical protein